MKVTFRLVILAIIGSFLTFSVNAQKHFSAKGASYQIKGIKEDKLIRIKPPSEFYEKSTSSTNFVVTYNGFTPNAKAAFQQAVDIWASIITSNRTIYIDAYWQSLEENVLGSAGPTNFFASYDGMPDDQTYYPIALAEKLTNADLNNPGSADIIAFFNSDADWYMGIDGNTPAGLFDLTTVVLHEICHGLGFVGSIEVEGEAGYEGWGDKKTFAFDQFLEDTDGNKIKNSSIFPNGSSELKNAVCGSPLYFNAPITNSTFGSKIELYTPIYWDEGSSVYHLSRSFEGSTNTLMLHSINSQTSIHDPGTVVTSMLKDMGWNSILIDHTPVVNRENVENINVEAEIFADYNTNLNAPTLHYSTNSGTFSEVAMVFNSSTNKYEAVIPITSNSEIDYYITVHDDFTREFKVPASAPTINYHVLVGPDAVAPKIVHTPKTFIIEGQGNMAIKAQITDDYNISNASIQLFRNENSIGTYNLYKGIDDEFNISLGIGALNLSEGEYLKYQLSATDGSSNANTTTYPETGFVIMNVEAVKSQLDSIVNNFETENSDFILDGFEIKATENFSSGILQTIHPYQQAGEGNRINTTATTRYPLLISSTTQFLSFDELVLVEPCEDGTTFGDEDFYDYVIVEAQKVGETEWFPLTEGYDSRANSDWFNFFNNLTVNGSSINVGTESLMRHRNIELIGNANMNIGNRVFIRFRLFSDAYTNGWGWAIDNVETKEILSSKIFANNGIKVYPNPVSEDFITITSSNKETIQQVEILNLLGQHIAHLSNGNANRYQIPKLKIGNYLLKIQTENKTTIQQLIIQ